MEQVMVSM